MGFRDGTPSCSEEAGDGLGASAAIAFVGGELAVGNWIVGKDWLV
jgi:hypothetical protein